MKKFLSMAMALVMTLSLCTFFAAPEAEASFTDSDQLSSKYAQQAADVIQTIEVMDGYDDGTFRPAAGLTRQAAAKIICNMVLGPTTARALPTNANPFPDVLAGNQFSGYISYCSQQNIISGYADGTFRGGDPLSGYAFLKMLLGALGYGQQEEGFVGDNWKVNVAKLALGIGLTKRDVDGSDSDFDGTVQVTREDAAIYAFNTLQADMVEYSSSSTLEINGVKVTMGNVTATPQTWSTSSTSADNINNAKTDGTNQRPIVQFAERYFDRLRREPNRWNTYSTDDFGRPSIKWFWKGVEVGTYSRDADVSFVGNVKVNAIYNGLQMTSGDSTAYLYINSGIENSRTLNVARDNDKNLDKEIKKDNLGFSSNLWGDGNHYVDRIGNGTKIECFRNDATNHVDVCVISVYGGKVNAVKSATSKKDAYVTIDYQADNQPFQINKSGNNEYVTEDFEEDDVVAYTYSDSAQGIQSMYKMSSAGGALQSRVATKSLRLDSTTYTYGQEYAFEGNLTEGNLTNKSSYVVYLDENDYVLWVEEDEFAVDQYALVERIYIETTNADGTHTTSTSSTLGTDVEEGVDGLGTDNDAYLQAAFDQVKGSIGTSNWDAQARLRFSNGTVRTVTLDDSKNYRTSKANDTAAMASVIDNGVGNAPGYATSESATKKLLVSNGDGDGNWIATNFTAGNIVRYSVNNSVYKLHSIAQNTRQGVIKDFGIANKKMGRFNSDANSAAVLTDGITRITADSETRFIVEDRDNGTWRYYTGIKQAPDLSADDGTYDATAYVYHSDGVAKLVFVSNARVSSSSSDILFIAATSASKLITANDTDDYFTFSAVEKGEIKSVNVRRGTQLTQTQGVSLNVVQPMTQDDAKHCVILNKVTYDSNDLITKGSFQSKSLEANRLQGIRRVNSEEVDLNTYYSASRHDLADSVKVYFVDGSDIEQIAVSEIATDKMDLVYYVEDDGEITYLFIVDNDEVVADSSANATIFPSGTFTATNAAGNALIYHYEQGMSVTRKAILAELGKSLGLWTSDSDPGGKAVDTLEDGSYVFEMEDGETYTVECVQDGAKLVVGSISGAEIANKADLTVVDEDQYVVGQTVIMNKPSVDEEHALVVDAVYYEGEEAKDLSYDETDTQISFEIPNCDSFQVEVYAIEKEEPPQA